MSKNKQFGIQNPEDPRKPIGRLIPDFTEARRHLEALDAGLNAQFTFQTFLDHEADEETKRRLVRIFHGAFDHHKDELVRLNNLGAGIYVTVNKTDGRGRKAANITSVRAVFADMDEGILPALPIEPSFIVASKRGDHPYWLVDETTTTEQFTSAQKAISHHLKSDKKVCDPPRVMRLSGFYHMKNPKEPFLVRVKSQSKSKYSIPDILSAFPPKAETPPRNGTGIAPAANCDRFLDWARALPAQEGSKNSLGGRNCTLLLLIREGLGCGTPEKFLREVARSYCLRSGEGVGIADAMLERQIKQHQKTPFVSYCISPKKTYTATEIAEYYLLSRNLIDNGNLQLRFYKGVFYGYAGNRYIKMSQTDLRADIIAFLQNSSPKGKQATTSFVNNVVANLEGKTLVPEATRIPSFLSQPERQGSRLITVKNGIFDVQQNMAGNESFLQAHTSDFFSTSCLPFEYCQTAKCPTWIKFLNKMLPDHEIQTFLQEWFGYNLIFDTSQHKFVLFIGEGANGKTVVCVVLRALLGQENISAVGLEQFNPTRTFPLAAMSGKLANIVEEIGEVDKVAEGILKNFVAGGVMTIERKNQDAFETTATARLTFATNVLPRFKDRSSGLWRRMMPIPFCVQILNPAEQNRKLTDSAWWEESNELSGILNWAIQGLVRLNERGHFTEPSACRKLREEYRDEANPAATFLQENCISQPNKIISTTHLYKIYSDWMEGQNCKALGQPQFAREVKKKFPKAILSPNAKRQSDTSRSREWMGIGLLVKNGMLVEEMDDKL